MEPSDQIPAKQPKGQHGGKRESNKPKCGQISKSTGKPCPRVAGWGTKHKGSGRCRTHGGNAPIKHGLYSKAISEQRQAIINELLALPPEQLFTLHREFAFVKACINEFCELTYGVPVAVLKEDEQVTVGGIEFLNEINRQVLLVDLFEKASKIYERYHKIELARAGLISQKQFHEFIAGFWKLCVSKRYDFGKPEDIRAFERDLQVINITGYAVEPGAGHADVPGRS